jgi:uncharacterized protein with PIN domain
MESNQDRFIADVMLGRLAKWLRIIGYDTLYFRDIDDSQLIHRAAHDDRVLLTRDIELCGRSGFRGLFIEKEDLESQLVQVIRDAGLKPQIGAGVRCPGCNELLLNVPRKEVSGSVPPYVLATHRIFTRCPGCSKIFWKGTHWEKIIGRLGKMGLFAAPPEP